MNDPNLSNPVIPHTQSDPKLKSYYCPHCNKLIMKGDVKRLSMTCPHCLELVEADGEELTSPNFKS